MMEQIEHVTPGNVLFSELKACPEGCGCWFTCSVDLALHRRVCPRPPEWRPSDYGDGVEICPCEGDVRLKTAIVQNGRSLVIGSFEYSLNQKRTFIKRRRV